jgi:hypothetical protein
MRKVAHVVLWICMLLALRADGWGGWKWAVVGVIGLVILSLYAGKEEEGEGVEG